MCGLYGFIGTPSEKSQQVVFNLGLINEKRGKDSSGMAYYNGKKFKITKRVEPSHIFLKHSPAQKGIKSGLVIGHTRFATHGEVNWDNAHPFQHGDWIFAHNGVIVNFEELNQKLGKNYEVDSQVIGDLLPNRINELRGSYAIVAFNINEPDKIYFWRMFSPLFIAISDEGCFFSSIGTALQDNLPNYVIKEAPNGSNGIIQPGNMSFNLEPSFMPILFNSFRLVGPDAKGEYHATTNLNAKAFGFEGRARSCPIRGLEQRFVC